jgi:hypothetical protein
VNPTKAAAKNVVDEMQRDQSQNTSHDRDEFSIPHAKVYNHQLRGQ